MYNVLKDSNTKVFQESKESLGRHVVITVTLVKEKLPGRHQYPAVHEKEKLPFLKLRKHLGLQTLRTSTARGK